LGSFFDEKEVTTQSCVEQYPLVFCLTSIPSLASSMLSRSPFKCFLGLFRAFFFEFSHLLGFFNNFYGLTFHELLIFSPKILSRATTAVTLPVLEFSIAILLALIVSGASLVALTA